MIMRKRKEIYLKPLLIHKRHRNLKIIQKQDVNIAKLHKIMVINFWVGKKIM